MHGLKVRSRHFRSASQAAGSAFRHLIAWCTENAVVPFAGGEFAVRLIGPGTSGLNRRAFGRVALLNRRAANNGGNVAVLGGAVEDDREGLAGIGSV